jgi:hypothetical protein
MVAGQLAAQRELNWIVVDVGGNLPDYDHRGDKPVQFLDGAIQFLNSKATAG